MVVEKWFSGKSFVELLDEMRCLATLARHDLTFSTKNRDYFDEFMSKFDELKMSISDEKAWYFGHNTTAYDNFVAFDIELCRIKKNLIHNKPIYDIA